MRLFHYLIYHKINNGNTAKFYLEKEIRVLHCLEHSNIQQILKGQTTEPQFLATIFIYKHQSFKIVTVFIEKSIKHFKTEDFV
jgi:hypothetical protein